MKCRSARLKRRKNATTQGKKCQQCRRQRSHTHTTPYSLPLVFFDKINSKTISILIWHWTTASAQQTCSFTMSNSKRGRGEKIVRTFTVKTNHISQTSAFNNLFKLCVADLQDNSETNKHKLNTDSEVAKQDSSGGEAEVTVALEQPVKLAPHTSSILSQQRSKERAAPDHRARPRKRRSRRTTNKSVHEWLQKIYSQNHKTYQQNGLFCADDG